jgi:nicotinate dehydrogenase subunit B
MSSRARASRGIDIDTNESDPSHSLAGQLMGLPLKSLQGFGVPAESYGFASKRLAWETIAPLLERASPLRTGHLRDPVGPQIQFASESFIDEIAAAIGSDPLAFRLRYLKAPRDIAVVKAAAERAQWDPRPSPRHDHSGDTLSGRGIAYAQRSGAVVAIVAEVEIDRRSGKVTRRGRLGRRIGPACGGANHPAGCRLRFWHHKWLQLGKYSGLIQTSICESASNRDPAGFCAISLIDR